MTASKLLMAAGAQGPLLKTVTFDGDGLSNRSITGVGFKPDMLWIKKYDETIGSIDEDWYIQDSVRGVGPTLRFDVNAAEYSSSGIISLDADGFTIRRVAGLNNSGRKYIAFCFKTTEGTTASNSDGTITTTTSVDNRNALSIMGYTGNGASSQTIGHGLGKAPSIIFFKKRNATGDWHVHIPGDAPGVYFSQLTTNGRDTSLQPAAPTSSVINLKDLETDVNGSTDTHIAYAFADTSGLVLADRYTGNGSTTGPIVNVGFRPSLLLIKRRSAGAWYLWSDKINTTNPRDDFVLRLNDDSNGLVGSSYAVDFTDTGFQVKTTNTEINLNGQVFSYLAIAGD